MVIGIHLDIEESDVDSRDKRIRCAKYLTETINNMFISIKAKKNVTYLAHTINVAIFLFLRNKKSYDVFRESGLLCLTHPNTLQPILKDLKFLPGEDPNIYLSLKEEMLELEKQVICHTMMDEIKFLEYSSHVHPAYNIGGDRMWESNKFSYRTAVFSIKSWHTNYSSRGSVGICNQ